MSRTPGAHLARIKAAYPLWTIAPAPGRTIGWVATREGQRIYAAHLGELEQLLAEAEDPTRKPR